MNQIYEQMFLEINWGKSTKIAPTKIALMEKYTLEGIEQAEEYANMLLSKLHNAGITDLLSEHNQFYGYSVHDCLCHMVSFGERFVDLVISQPKIAIYIFDSQEYAENFFYVFPSQADYEMVNKEYHATMAEDALKDLELAKTELLSKYTSQFLHSTGGYDFDMAKTVLEEIIAGFKNDTRTYKEIFSATKNLGDYALYANRWSDFVKFCKI